MATWTDIPDEVLEPGKPARSVDALALRDNAIAIAEGAAGAPKVTENAMDLNSIHGNRLRSGTVANAQIANMDAGKLNSGTVPGARMPMGLGGVGTYGLFQGPGGNPDTTASGSSLIWASAGGGSTTVSRPGGTWRKMGHSSASSGPGAITVWIRIS